MISRKANILQENLVFSLLNFAFFAILIVFIYSRTGDPSILEEKYSKQIAMMIDAAKPGMLISFDMKEVLDASKKQNWERDKIVSFEGNSIRVQLKKDGGYTYHFFNDVSPVADLLPNGILEIKIKDKSK
jgi:hypothetical protein